MIIKIVKKRSQGKTILSWKTLKVWVFVMHAKYPSVVTIYDAYRGKYGESILRTLTHVLYIVLLHVVHVRTTSSTFM